VQMRSRSSTVHIWYRRAKTIANERHHERKQDSNGENNDRARL
jgi:hypothetical protein